MELHEGGGPAGRAAQHPALPSRAPRVVPQHNAARRPELRIAIHTTTLAVLVDAQSVTVEPGALKDARRMLSELVAVAPRRAIVASAAAVRILGGRFDL